MLYPIINVIISSFVAIKVDIFEYVGRGFYDQDMDDYIDKFFIVWYHIGHRSEDIWYELQTGWDSLIIEFYSPLFSRYRTVFEGFYPIVKLILTMHWAIDFYSDFYLKLRWTLNRFLDDVW